MSIAGQLQDAPAEYANVVNPLKLLMDATKNKYPVTPLPASDEGKPADGLGYAIQTPDGRTVSVYVDKTTKLVSRMVFTSDKTTANVLLSKYQATKGVQIP